VNWLQENLNTVLAALGEHVRISFAALALGLVLAIPIALAAHRWPAVYGPLLALTQVIYSIPSIALFVLLISFVGLGPVPVVIGLALYSLVILLRNVVEGLRAVGGDVRESADAMGYSWWRKLVEVEFPLAAPALVAGLRLAAVSTISLVSVGALIGTGGLGQLFIHGFQIDNPIEVWIGIVATLLLALVVDLAIVAVGRVLAPWLREAR
jgi:osmoprotectant transport system permease protein